MKTLGLLQEVGLFTRKRHLKSAEEAYSVKARLGMVGAR